MAIRARQQRTQLTKGSMTTVLKSRHKQRETGGEKTLLIFNCICPLHATRYYTHSPELETNKTTTYSEVSGVHHADRKTNGSRKGVFYGEGTQTVGWG